jgi:hypothetical protein
MYKIKYMYKDIKLRKFIATTIRQYLNENSNLSFSYRGTELPTQEMIDWFDYEFNQEPENMDDLESDMWSSNQEKEFFEEFKNELMDLSYFQMLDVFTKARYKKY